MLAGFGKFPGWRVEYLISSDSLADDFGVLVDPDIGRGGETRFE